VLYNRCDELPIDNRRLEHLGDGLFFKYAFFLAFNGQTDVDRAAFSSGDLCSETCLGQVNLTRVGTVDLYHRCSTSDLDSK